MQKLATHFTKPLINGPTELNKHNIQVYCFDGPPPHLKKLEKKCHCEDKKGLESCMQLLKEAKENGGFVPEETHKKALKR